MPSHRAILVEEPEHGFLVFVDEIERLRDNRPGAVPSEQGSTTPGNDNHEAELTGLVMQDGSCIIDDLTSGQAVVIGGQEDYLRCGERKRMTATLRLELYD